ncbi:MAG: hypothetical protein ACP5PZ_07925 [Bacteroidales bacterium]
MNQLIEKLQELVPIYSSNPEDSFAEGNVAVCIIDENGNVCGKIWGNNKAKGSKFFKIACIKAIQTWITGMKTGEFERKLFNGEVQEEDFGIQAPDLIGWEGGQPISLKSGEKLYVGFSGFRGFNDLQIVIDAVNHMEN